MHHSLQNPFTFLNLTILLHLLIFLTLLTPSSSECRSQCGDIPIHYPFNIDDGCGAPQFRNMFSCNASSTSLFFITLNGNYKVQSIDYKLQTLTVYDPDMSTCTVLQPHHDVRLTDIQYAIIPPSPDTVFALLNCSVDSPILHRFSSLCFQFAGHKCEELYNSCNSFRIFTTGGLVNPGASNNTGPAGYFYGGGGSNSFGYNNNTGFGGGSGGGGGGGGGNMGPGMGGGVGTGVGPAPPGMEKIEMEGGLEAPIGGSGMGAGPGVGTRETIIGGGGMEAGTGAPPDGGGMGAGPGSPIGGGAMGTGPGLGTGAPPGGGGMGAGPGVGTGSPYEGGGMGTGPGVGTGSPYEGGGMGTGPGVGTGSPYGGGGMGAPGGMGAGPGVGTGSPIGGGGMGGGTGAPLGGNGMPPPPCCFTGYSTLKVMSMNILDCTHFTSFYGVDKLKGVSPMDWSYGLKFSYSVPDMGCERCTKSGGNCGFDVETEALLCLCPDSNNSTRQCGNDTGAVGSPWVPSLILQAFIMCLGVLLLC